jgi:hypothetical protein
LLYSTTQRVLQQPLNAIANQTSVLMITTDVKKSSVSHEKHPQSRFEKRASGAPLKKEARTSATWPFDATLNGIFKKR